VFLVHVDVDLLLLAGAAAFLLRQLKSRWCRESEKWAETLGRIYKGNFRVAINSTGGEALKMLVSII
jgi:hypothetical protein